MKRRPVLLLISIAIAAALIGGGMWLYDWVLGSTLKASEPITAAPVILPDIVSASPTPLPPTQQVVESTNEASHAPAVQEDTPAPATAEAAAQPEFVLFSIQPAESQARFIIYEELNGVPTNVVGATNQVAGEAAVGLEDLGETLLGEIRINARTLATDQDRRNNAIRNRILFTDQYEFITFVPTEMRGLSGSAGYGEIYTFQVTGDLTIRNVTQPVTFDVTVTYESEERLAGSASAIVTLSQFNLSVPSVPFVANVAEEILLEIDFVMLRVER
jgi:polyisoprenoid-binding protein YceI